MSLPDGIVVGARLRGVQVEVPPFPPRQLAHVRAVFDDRAAIRWWKYGRWNYEIIHPAAFVVGLWSLE